MPDLRKRYRISHVTIINKNTFIILCTINFYHFMQIHVNN